MNFFVKPALFAIAFCSTASASDYALVFGQPETHKELGLGPEAMKFSQEINGNYLAGIRNAHRTKAEHQHFKDLRDDRDFMIFEYLNPRQQERFRQLVFQVRLLENRPEQALAGMEVELTTDGNRIGAKQSTCRVCCPQRRKTCRDRSTD